MLGIAVHDDDEKDVRWNGEPDTRLYPASGLLGSGRRVVHVVIDTTQTDEVARARLYLDGQLLTPATRVRPPQNDALSFSAVSTFELFNRGGGQRSFGGTGHYAAMYDIAMSPQEVARHVEILLVSDDA